MEVEEAMKKYLPLIFVFNFSFAQAGLVNLDFTSGVYSDEKGVISNGLGKIPMMDTYMQDGFKLTTVSAGNHLDPNYMFATVGFHNGPVNPVLDNNLILTYTGGAFDLTSINLSAFSSAMYSLDLIASDGTTATFNNFVGKRSLGVKPLSFLNITSVIFSASGADDDAGAGWGGLTVNNSPSAVPVPSAVWFLGSGLIGLFGVRNRFVKPSTLPA